MHLLPSEAQSHSEGSHIGFCSSPVHIWHPQCSVFFVDDFCGLIGPCGSDNRLVLVSESLDVNSSAMWSFSVLPIPFLLPRR